MLDPTAGQFSQDDRDEMLAMGQTGWEKLLLSLEPRLYPDPFGNGTSYYERTADALHLREAFPVHSDPSSAPHGAYTYDNGSQEQLWSYQADTSYVIDEDAPTPTARKVWPRDG
ncbi:hypothetical protein Lfu02_62880 [Longispora fulva]|uniref:Uncharacterized protein n=1 Tax=Longispora fulva TaxID=619741 RepID=A0A8J7GDW5_9ACTN|nr:hypothetical protein [Longispora fulva]MBG6134707.1 hypothetical protein [Longispora fulva]GIG61916.1 hypothetical protein Lfu02_62880 [Longispora fulva]